MKTKKSSFGKAFLKPFCFAKAFTKNTSWKKRFVLAAIAVCTLILSAVAFPALLTGASADTDAFTLGIYGNANEDDAIDMRDFTHTARIICWLEEETTLADANYDGEIDVGDMTQIGLIILERESELTIIDAEGRDVTINKPVNRIVCAIYGTDAEVIRALEAKEKVVGVDEYVTQQKVYFPELSEVTSIGDAMFGLDVEEVIGLNPDLVIAFSTEWGMGPVIDAGVTVACFELYKYNKGLAENVTKLGYILDKEEEAKEFIDFIQHSADDITEKVKDIPEDEKPTVYIESNSEYRTPGEGGPPGSVCTFAGGKNIATAITESCCEVEREWVVGQNPDIIIKMVIPGYGSVPVTSAYDTDDVSGMKELRDEIMNRPELAGVKAVETGQVYVMCCRPLAFTPAYCVGIPYMAKAFHPDIFSDLDANEIHQQYVTEFQGLDFDVYEHGVWVYHPVYFPEGR